MCTVLNTYLVSELKTIATILGVNMKGVKNKVGIVKKLSIYAKNNDIDFSSKDANALVPVCKSSKQIGKACVQDAISKFPSLRQQCLVASKRQRLSKQISPVPVLDPTHKKIVAVATPQGIKVLHKSVPAPPILKKSPTILSPIQRKALVEKKIFIPPAAPPLAPPLLFSTKQQEQTLLKEIAQKRRTPAKKIIGVKMATKTEEKQVSEQLSAQDDFLAQIRKGKKLSKVKCVGPLIWDETRRTCVKPPEAPSSFFVSQLQKKFAKAREIGGHFMEEEEDDEWL